MSVGFSPTKLRSDSRTVACRCADLTIAEALNRLLIGLPVRYEERENQIVVVPGAGTPLMPEVAALNVTEAAALPIITTNQRIAADSIVSGRVVDAASRAPLADARITVAGGGRTAVTDARGEFRVIVAT
ncbi:MAG TPA: STN and carboxypeptidase regulatory-like domain-containing protein, partial [Gemmatimonadales bacterium]|nr:STN and carboxypeptidase regulatory-like domain-containing protein [Gemmatimonadales bacterium]